MSSAEKMHGKFLAGSTKVFEKQKCENCKELVENLIECYRKQGYRMLSKLHYLYSHLDFFGEI